MAFSFGLLFAGRSLCNDSLMLELQLFDDLLSVRVVRRNTRIAQNTWLLLALFLGFFPLFAIMFLYLSNDLELVLKFDAFGQRLFALLGHALPRDCCPRNSPKDACRITEEFEQAESHAWRYTRETGLYACSREYNSCVSGGLCSYGSSDVRRGQLLPPPSQCVSDMHAPNAAPGQAW